jgi:hypothetical protein
MKAMGFEKIGNLRPGIIGYSGEIQKGWYFNKKYIKKNEEQMLLKK